jgi:hypothetical protein
MRERESPSFRSLLLRRQCNIRMFPAPPTPKDMRRGTFSLDILSKCSRSRTDSELEGRPFIAAEYFEWTPGRFICSEDQRSTINERHEMPSLHAKTPAASYTRTTWSPRLDTNPAKEAPNESHERSQACQGGKPHHSQTTPPAPPGPGPAISLSAGIGPTPHPLGNRVPCCRRGSPAKLDLLAYCSDLRAGR